MASLNQLSEILAERVGRQTDLAFRQELKVIINNWRVRLIKDSLDTKPTDRKFFTKWLEIPLVKVNQSDFPDYPCDKILKTKCEVPAPVRSMGILFDFVGKLSKTESFNVKEPYYLKYLLASKYSGTLASYVNNHIWIFNNLDLTGIAVSLIPESIDKFNKCSLESNTEIPQKCYTDDDEYPVSVDIQQRILQSILAVELRNLLVSEALAQTKEDK